MFKKPVHRRKSGKRIKHFPFKSFIKTQHQVMDFVKSGNFIKNMFKTKEYTVPKASILSELYLEVPYGPSCIERKFSRFIFWGTAQNIFSFLFCINWRICIEYHKRFKLGIITVGGRHCTNCSIKDTCYHDVQISNTRT